MKPVNIKATSTAEFLADIKAKAEAFDKLSPEERAANIKATAEILAKLGPDGPTAISVRKK